MLDEPTAGLDPISAAAFDELLMDLRQQLGLTVIMITHDLDTIFRTCNRVGVIIDRKMTSDTLEGITANPTSVDPGLFPRRARASASGRQRKRHRMEREANYTAVGRLRAAHRHHGRRCSSTGTPAVPMTRDYTRYEIYFEGSVSGLNRGSTVRYLGVEVGRVVAIRIDKRAAIACR